MNAIFVIAENTVRQTIRQRLFYNVGVFGVGMLLLSMVVGRLTFGYPDRVVRSIGLSGVSISLNLIALLIAVSLIHQEIDRKTLFVVLTRPVHRWQYVFGRYLGLLVTLGLASVGLTIVYALTLTASRGTMLSQDFIALSTSLVEAAILGGIGIVLSAFSTPMLSSGIGLGLWIACTAIDDVVRLAEKTEDPLTIFVTKTAYYILPNLSRFNWRELAIYKLEPPVGELFMSFGYGALYALGLVALSSAILSRREMI